MIQIRAAEEKDASVVLKWSNSKAIWAVDSPNLYVAKSLPEFLPSWQAVVARSSAWIIERQGVAVGHLGWIEHAEGVCEFYIIIGDATAMGRGIGRTAMVWLLNRARESGLNALYGRVLGNNPRALSFFAQLGATEIGRNPDHFERGGMYHDLHWMRFDLVETSKFKILATLEQLVRL